MKVCVMGMWHLGSVTAGCLAKLGFEVNCLDFNEYTIQNFKKHIMPIEEPGLKDLFVDYKDQIDFFDDTFP